MARRAESADAENNVMMRERDNLLAEKDTFEVLERQVETLRNDITRLNAANDVNSWALKEASIVTIDIIKYRREIFIDVKVLAWLPLVSWNPAVAHRHRGDETVFPSHTRYPPPRPVIPTNTLTIK
jgi:hypothetical protein